MTDFSGAEPHPEDDSGGYCCVMAGMHMGHDEDCPEDNPGGWARWTPYTLAALAARLRAIHPTLDLSWANVIDAHTDEWEVTEGLNGVLEIALRRTQSELATALREKEALEAQLRGVGITPYLDRMAELAARVEALMKMYQEQTGDAIEDIRRIMDDYVAALAPQGEEKP